MAKSEVCPTEDAIQALLECLVHPVLPAKSSLWDTPSLSHQQSVAKQVHAVVLLYNYYLRKQHSQLEVLDFEAFCKLAVILKPTLLAHMKLMQRSNETKLDDLEKQLSMTEKRIMEACDISTRLDSSKDVPDIEGWPTSKVAVLLVDSKKENCLLLFSSITHGVWSVIEKDLDVSCFTPKCMSDVTKTDKKKRFIRKPSKGEPSVDESALLKVAYLAVKEATGIDESGLLVLESDVVYSHTKEKTAARFCIMQCTQSVNEDFFQISIKDVVESLQGPLVRKSSCGWMATPVINYFHVLPYAEIVSRWLSRKVFSSSLQNLSVVEENSNVNSTDRTEKPCTQEIQKGQDRSHVGNGLLEGFSNKTKGNNIESPKLKGDSGSHMIVFSSSLQNLSVVEGNSNVNSSDRTEKPCTQEIQNSEDRSRVGDGLMGRFSNETKGSSVGSPKLNVDSGSHRIVFSSSLQNLSVIEGYSNLNSSKGTEKPCTQEIQKSEDRSRLDDGLLGGFGNETKVSNIESPKPKGNSGSHTSALCDSPNGLRNSNADDSFMFSSPYGEKCKNIANTSLVENPEEKDEMVDWMKYSFTNNKAGKSEAENRTSNNIPSVQDGIGDHVVVACKSNSTELDNLQNCAASKQNELLHATLRILLCKRGQLSLQLRHIEDEIAQCDNKILKFLNDKIECGVEGCTDVCTRSSAQTSTYQQHEDQQLPQHFKRKRFSVDVLNVKNPCQELDSVCHENNWILPTYNVSKSDGGFKARVSVEGTDFECSSSGEPCFNPHEARESAAVRILANLRRTGSSTL